MTVKLEFIGATDTVTGSRTLVTYRGKTWLVDCGLFQGSKPIRDRNREPLPLPPHGLAGVILTHAHLDHSGYLPRLWKEGHRPRVLATSGTVDLCRILLLDAAKLEEESADYAERSGYSHHKPAEPLFRTEDAEGALTLLVPVARDQWIQIEESVSVRFLRAGHIIGASMVQFLFEGEAGGRILTFSGDVGNDRSHIMKGPATLPESDALVLESTYGDRLQPRSPSLPAFAAIVNRTLTRGGVLVVPAFAVGRAQEVTYMMRLLEESNLIPKVPVLLDSPMASAAATIFLRHTEDQVVSSPFNSLDSQPFEPALFETVTSSDASMIACMRDGPMVVISASGMLNGGRILHHLKARLPDRRNTVMFTGFQAEGTKGRFLQEMQTRGGGDLRIHHQPIAVEAEIVTLDHLSSHADYQDTLEWLGRGQKVPAQILVNHGAPATQRSFVTRLTERFKIAASATCDNPKLELFRNTL